MSQRRKPYQRKPPPTWDGCECGQTHVAGCHGHSGPGKTQPCGKRPMQGAVVCRNHGGSAPHVRSKSAERIIEQRLVKVVETYGLRRDITPKAAVLEEVQESAGHVAWLRERVRQLEPDALVYGLTSEVDRQASEYPGVDVTYEAAINMWCQLYDRERNYLLRAAKTASDMGVNEEQIRVSRAMGEIFFLVVGELFARLGLPSDVAAQAQALAPAVMREVGSARFLTIDGTVMSA